MELLPCPFCGSSAIFHDSAKPWVSCSNADCSYWGTFHTWTSGDQRKQAIAAWNTRRPSQDVKWPEKYKCYIHDYKKPRPKEGGCSCMTDKIRNETIDACKKAWDERGGG